MRDDRRMSPDQIFWDYGISPYLLTLWAKRGLLSPTRVNAHGEHRYDRRAVEAVRDSEGFPRAALLPPKPKPARSKATTPRQPLVTTNERSHRVAKVRGLGPLSLPKDVIAAQKEAANNEPLIEKLLDAALFDLIGVGRDAMSAELHRRPERAIATFLGISVRRLQEICTLYRVRRPAEGYWSTRVENGARVLPAGGVPFAGVFAPGDVVSRDVE